MQPRDLFDGFDENLTLQNPGELLEAGVGGEVPGDDVLEVERNVVLQKNALILFGETGEKILRSGKVGQGKSYHAQLKMIG